MLVQGNGVGLMDGEHIDCQLEIMAYSMVKACKLVSTAMKARGVAKFPSLARARANEEKNRGFNFAIWRLKRPPS